MIMQARSHIYNFDVVILIMFGWIIHFSYRLAAIEENMKMMPKMIEEYRAKCREARRLLKEKKQDTEEQAYLKATGKIRQQHEWEKNRDKKKKKKFGKKKS